MVLTLKELVARWFNEIWNRRHLEVADELMGEGCVIHNPGLKPEDATTAAAFRSLAQAFQSAIPDIHIEIQDTVAERDQVVVRCLVTGTHTGEGLNVRPSNRPIRLSGMAWGRWRDGKLVEAWNNFDFLSLYEQIGAVERP